MPFVRALIEAKITGGAPLAARELAQLVLDAIDLPLFIFSDDGFRLVLTKLAALVVREALPVSDTPTPLPNILRAPSMNPCVSITVSGPVTVNLPDDERLAAQLKQTAAEIINTLKEAIMATQAELAAQLAASADQTEKALGEITAAIADLTAAVAAAGTVTPEVQAAADRLKALAQTLDDLNPDPAAP